MVPAGDDALEHALDELYDVDPSEFTATRTRLAADLRATDAAASKALKAARRPTTAAWAMNRLSRDTPALLEDLLARSEELRVAQTGERGGLRDATRAQRDALAAATEAAMAVLGDRATDAFRAQVSATLHAGSVDADVAELLRRGRLTKEVSGVSGFPEVPGLTLVPPLPSERPPAKKKAPPRARRPVKSGAGAAASPPATDDIEVRRAAEADAREKAREREERARRELEAAEAAAAQAEDAAADAEQARDEAHERARTLETDLERARREAREADTAAARARREATRIARAATRLRARRPQG